MDERTRHNQTRLTARQRRFLEEFAVDRNATQAYLRAFGRNTSSGKPRSYRAAQVSASRLLSNPIIRDEIDAALKDQIRRTRMTADRWVRRLACIANLDIDDLYEADPATGMPVPRRWEDVPVTARMALRGVRVRQRGEVTEVEYTACDRMRALELIGRHFGYLNPPTPLDQLLNSLPRRAAEVIRRALDEATQ